MFRILSGGIFRASSAGPTDFLSRRRHSARLFWSGPEPGWPDRWAVCEYSADFRQEPRILCEGKPSASAIARDLDISHVQFHRFLRGEAVPKPAVLKRICDYFGVGSRILTATLDEIEISGLVLPAEGLRPEMAQMFGYVALGAGKFRGSGGCRAAIWSRCSPASGTCWRWRR